jgi:hypothetical protein
MTALDLDAIRREVRALDFERGTPADVAEWREADAESRANLAIEGSVAKIVKLEHAWRRLNGWSDDGFQVAPFPG